MDACRNVIKEQIKPMNERCQLAHEEIYDKVEVEEALRRTVAEVRKTCDLLLAACCWMIFKSQLAC